MIFTKNPAQASHLMLDGGMFGFKTIEEEEQFLTNYAQEMEITQYGEPHFYVERKTPTFWFFMELDYIGEVELSESEVDAIASLCQRVVIDSFHRQLRPESSTVDSSVAVYRAAAKELPNGGGIKSGIHFIWRIPVILNTAWQLRRVILNSIATTTTPFPTPTIPWEDVLDSCVYKENGLRMVGSRKTEICSKCKGVATNDIKKGNSCATCQTTGKVDAGRPYVFYKSFAANGEVDLEKTEMYTYSVKNAVIRGSIRCNATKPWAINWENSSFKKDEIQKLSGIDRRTPQQPQNKKRDRGLLSAKTVNLINDTLESQRFEPLINFISSHFPGEPAATKVTHVADPDTPIFFVNTNSRWCANNNGEHTASKIYFVVRAYGIEQRCYCANSTIRHPNGIRCSQFQSKPIPLNKELVKMYFTKSVMDKTLKQNGKRNADIDPVSNDYGHQRKVPKNRSVRPHTPHTLHDLLIQTQTTAFLQPCKK